MEDKKIIEEDLRFVKEAISVLDGGLNTKETRLKLLGLLYIIETFYYKDMQQINIHDRAIVGNIMIISIDEKSDTKTRLRALRYTLEKLKEQLIK